MIESLHINLKGKIQGVGFRPFVYQLATSLGLRGYVRNDGGGVEILLQGWQKERFLDLLFEQMPKMARVDCVQQAQVLQDVMESFEILSSQEDGQITLAPIEDIRICQDCKEELLDPLNRRFFYPLINCTHCGPRHSVIEGFPYDRSKTSMQPFKMCAACQEEYSNPHSRFFHAQPTSCPQCSPAILWDNQEVKDYRGLFKKIAHSLRMGEIIAIKGIGGFHLVCDATNTQSIQTLRKHKNRPQKPFALMCKDMQMVKALAEVNAFEQEALCCAQSPIVILKAKKILHGIAPHLKSYGIMLPYTPIYTLLFEEIDFPLVVTSANEIGDPICYEDHHVAALSFSPSHILSHQRRISYPLEDSVIEFLPQSSQAIILRLARGFAPKSYNLAKQVSTPFLAMGANQKSSFALAFKDLLILSPYIGDLETISSIERFKELLNYFCKIYHLQTFQIICDLHPYYQSTKLAFELSDEYGCANPPIQIQHHFAHALSVCYEYGITHEVLAFCFDGTGYGSDGNIWGGEVLIVSPQGFRRILSFRHFSLLGGERAIKEISRLALSLLLQDERISLEQIRSYMLSRGISSGDLDSLMHIHQRGINAPLSSSVGRIFDAIAWFCGLEKSSYEGEGGIYVQELYDESVKEFYSYEQREDEIRLNILEIFQEVLLGRECYIIASKFINTLVKIVWEISSQYAFEVVLCGGVFCNQILSSKVLEKFHRAKKTCYIGKNIPPNDNGIALGQIYYLLQGGSNAR